MSTATAVVVSNENGLAQEIVSGKHRWRSDEPAPFGTDTGPSPYELLLAGLGACTAITLRMYAERKGWQLGTIHVDLELHKDDEGDTGRIARVVSFSAPLQPEQKARLAEIAEKTPVTRTIKAGAVIETTFR